MGSTLILLRHGQSTWNKENLFTGWYDCPLSDQGRAEATNAGRALAEAGIAPTVVHTSVQTRAVVTANLALDAMARSWLPVRRHWRLNERHYGDLTGKNKAETAEKYGDEQVLVWRRSYDVPPPPIAADNTFNPNDDIRYAALAPEVVPASECLKDVVGRMLPYWHDAIVPDLRAGEVVLVVAHGNSLRALVKHLDDIADDDIVGLNIPTGVPVRYDLDDDMRPADRREFDDRYVGDADAARAAAEAVARQASSG
ncbi:MAG: phosphoglyceromutase [Acidimicrobiales bacterium]|nr:phosphoglyceromutase [Acidimicrobiales bacterium]